MTNVIDCTLFGKEAVYHNICDVLWVLLCEVRLKISVRSVQLCIYVYITQVESRELFICFVLHGAYLGSALQVLVQGCQLDCADLEQFLHQIYQQLRALENNIAEVLQQQHKQARETSFICLALL